jgi:hypothetical protein
MKKHLIATLAGLSFALLVSGQAHAAGLEMDASALPAAARTSLAGDIAKARAVTPHQFANVRDLIANADALDAKSRKRGMAFTPRFKAMGPNALMPMLEAIAFDAHAPMPSTETARTAVRVGLLEAIGSIRDDRAVPVLEHVLDHGVDVHLVQAASTALARIGTDASVAILVRAQANAQKAEPGGTRERAILGGMHDGRRAAIAKVLAARLSNADEATAKVVAHSLGGAANAWAWSAIGDKAELAETRAVAGKALVDLYAARTGEVREAAAKAVLVVDDPSTPTYLGSAKKGATADLVTALDELERRFVDNPARR